MNDTVTLHSCFRLIVMDRLLAMAAVLALLAVLGGCASPIPRAIRDPLVNPVVPTQVQQQPDRYLGQRVRWGGTIMAVKNLPAITEIEVMARDLDADGEPQVQGDGQGRFIAQIGGFLDPAEFEKERFLTVAGVLVGVEKRPVGDYPYAYPLVRVDSRYLWPKAPPPQVYVPYGYPAYGYPGWYGPGYGPRLAPYGFYRGSGWPYRRR
jgi:outer membrane lipoprotein